MKQEIRLNEEQFNRLIEEAVKRIITEDMNEEMEEGWWNDAVDGAKAGLSAVKDVFTGRNGNASFNTHYANRQVAQKKNRIGNLMNKYGVQNGQNRNQYVNAQSAEQVQQIEQKYDAKIQQLQQQKEAEIAKLKQKIGGNFDKYKSKKDEYSKDKSKYQTKRRNLKNTQFQDF